MRPYLGSAFLCFSLLLGCSRCVSSETGLPYPPAGGSHESDASAVSLADAGSEPQTHDAEVAPGQDAAELPPEVAYEPRDVAANGFTFRVWVAGPAHGEVVMLLHGFPQTSYQWRYVVAALVEAGYRVIAPDQRGYSPGARPTSTEDYNLVFLARDVLALADALSAPAFHLVGHDWGGGVAWLVAKFAPARVMSLTSVSTPHPDALRTALDDPNSCQTSASAYMDVVVRHDAPKLMQEKGIRFLPEKYTDDPPDLAPYMPLLADEAALDAMLAWYRANIKERKVNALPLGFTETPTLMVFGENEQFFCRETAENSERFMRAPYRFELVKDVGHWVTEVAHVRMNQVLLSHLLENRARVSGSAPFGPDKSRPLAAGWSGYACKGAPDFEISADLQSCSACPEAHCLPGHMVGEGSSLLPECPEAGAGAKCVPDAMSRTLGRFVFTSCKAWFSDGPAACVPKCLAGAFSLFLARDGCGEAELCAPCVNPLTGESTGACDDNCQGL